MNTVIPIAAVTAVTPKQRVKQQKIQHFEMTFRFRLCNVAHITSSSLLSILSRFKLNIPKDPRPFLLIKRQTVPQAVSGGSYIT